MSNATEPQTEIRLLVSMSDAESFALRSALEVIRGIDPYGYEASQAREEMLAEYRSLVEESDGWGNTQKSVIVTEANIDRLTEVVENYRTWQKTDEAKYETTGDKRVSGRLAAKIAAALPDYRTKMEQDRLRRIENLRWDAEPPKPATKSIEVKMDDRDVTVTLRSEVEGSGYAGTVSQRNVRVLLVQAEDGSIETKYLVSASWSARMGDEGASMFDSIDRAIVAARTQLDVDWDKYETRRIEQAREAAVALAEMEG